MVVCCGASKNTVSLLINSGCWKLKYEYMSYWYSTAACYSSKVEVTIRIRYRTPGPFIGLAHVCKPEIAFKIKNWDYLMIVDPLLLRIIVDRN